MLAVADVPHKLASADVSEMLASADVSELLTVADVPELLAIADVPELLAFAMVGVVGISGWSVEDVGSDVPLVSATAGGSAMLELALADVGAGCLVGLMLSLTPSA